MDETLELYNAKYEINNIRYTMSLMAKDFDDAYLKLTENFSKQEYDNFTIIELGIEENTLPERL